jgi:hypothetical protein
MFSQVNAPIRKSAVAWVVQIVGVIFVIELLVWLASLIYALAVLASSSGTTFWSSSAGGGGMLSISAAAAFRAVRLRVPGQALLLAFCGFLPVIVLAVLAGFINWSFLIDEACDSCPNNTWPRIWLGALAFQLLVSTTALVSGLLFFVELRKEVRAKGAPGAVVVTASSPVKIEEDAGVPTVFNFQKTAPVSATPQ